MMKTLQERLLFLYKFSKEPRTIGSVTPSSAFLAKKMIEPVPWKTAAHVAELGAGTGAITKYIDQAKSPDAKVLLFERDGLLQERLTAQFPQFPCYADATKLQIAMQREGVPALDCIISGLPFFNFPQTLRDQLMEQIVSSLKPGGLFIAFQYSQQMKSQFNRLFDIRQIDFVPWNLPPAFVYVCLKRPDDTA